MTVGTDIAAAVDRASNRAQAQLLVNHLEGIMWTLTIAESLQEGATQYHFDNKQAALDWAADNWEPSNDIVSALEHGGQFAENDHGVSISITLLGPNDTL